MESASIQGFTWDNLEYKVETEDGKTEKIRVNVDETAFLSMALRYKELFVPGDEPGGETGEDLPYEIDPHLTEINTGAIDRNYMETRFRKYLKQLQDGVETTAALQELRKSFAVLSQEQQKYARIFLTDVQQGNIVVEDDKTLIDYINQYQSEAHNDRIHRFAIAIGVDEAMLRDFMDRGVSMDELNAFGRFDRLKDSVDRDVAKAYFEEAEGKPIKAFRVPAMIDKILRLFISSGGFDVD